MKRLPGACALIILALSFGARAQVIEFESNGLKYQTLTRSGVTVMFAQLPARLHEYAIIQVAVSNGSGGPYVIKPEDFSYVRGEGATLRAAAARSVIGMLIQKGSGSDVIKLITTYEASLYNGSRNVKSTNGYETRRQAALAASGTRLKAAAAASALALVQTKLAPGESTDGAVFFPTEGKPLGPGRLVVRTNTDVFEFRSE